MDEINSTSDDPQFIDEFDLPEDIPLLPAQPGEVLIADDGIPLAKHEATLIEKQRVDYCK
jgi:hypothetical protein